MYYGSKVRHFYWEFDLFFIPKGGRKNSHTNSYNFDITLTSKDDHLTAWTACDLIAPNKQFLFLFLKTIYMVVYIKIRWELSLCKILLTLFQRTSLERSLTFSSIDVRVCPPIDPIKCVYNTQLNTPKMLYNVLKRLSINTFKSRLY